MLAEIPALVNVLLLKKNFNPTIFSSTQNLSSLGLAQKTANSMFRIMVRSYFMSSYWST